MVLLYRAISIAAQKPAPEGSVVISGLNRLHKIIAAGAGAYRMSRSLTTRDRLLSLMSDGKPRSTRQVSGQLGLILSSTEVGRFMLLMLRTPAIPGSSSVEA